LSYLLSHRGNMISSMVQATTARRFDPSQNHPFLRNQDYYDDFCTLVTNLSLNFSHVNDWIDTMVSWGINPLSESEKCLRIHSLQQAGILGLFHDDVVDNNSNRNKIKRNDMTQSYSTAPHLKISLVGFSELESIRDAASKIRPWLVIDAERYCQEALFSTYSPRNNIPPSVQCINDKRKGTTCRKNLIHHNIYCNSDCVRIIFSFLGYKRLIKMRLVSRMWKDVADSDQLWLMLYKSRYGFGPQSCDSLKFSSVDCISDYQPPPNRLYRSWKKLFQSRWQIERHIRLNYCKKDGWKWQICNHVGCMTILRSKVYWKKHYEKHHRELVSSTFIKNCISSTTCQKANVQEAPTLK
jgi:F-box domain